MVYQISFNICYKKVLITIYLHAEFHISINNCSWNENVYLKKMKSAARRVTNYFPTYIEKTFDVVNYLLNYWSKVYTPCTFNKYFCFPISPVYWCLSVSV